MAKILAGVLATQASGKVGDVVFTTSRFGAGVRIFGAPAQPDTSKQKGIKSSLKKLAHDWDTLLLDSDRTNWISLANANPRIDRFTQPIKLTGMQLFVSCNQALASIGVAEITPAPGSLTVTNPTSITITWTPPSGPLIVTPSVAPAGTEVAVVFATACMPAGRRVILSAKRQLGHFTVGTPGPYTITTMYLDKFLAFVANRMIGVGLRYTSSLTGAQSPLALALQLT